MNASVDQVYRLIGAWLRDSQRRCEGRVVGVDQTREAPALLIVWEGQPQAQRVELTAHDLHQLVQACVAPKRLPQDASDNDATDNRGDSEEAIHAVTWRRTAGS